MSRLLLTLAVLCTGAAWAQGQAAAEAERAEVRQRLAAQRAALALIESRKVSALEALEFVQQMAAASAQRVRVLERDLALLRRRLAAAEQEQAVLAEGMRELVGRASPRLWGLYRLTRRRPLEVLVSARDFAGLIWRARAMRATLEEDLQLLRTVQRVARLREQSARELRRLQGSLERRRTFLQEQAELARAQQEVLEEVVGMIQGEAELARRMVRDLDQADKELGQMLEDLTAGGAATGFGALRGKLPMPVEGVVEVWFGKVVNPRFNTVTVQKGLDIRAAAGTPVRAVAEGTVVYSGWLRGYGNLLILDHGDNFHTLVAHLASVVAPVGTNVAAGQVVGEVGDTGSLKGAYLYFEIRKAGQALDPKPWLAPTP